MQGLVKTCLETCAVDLTDVYSPALFNERSMQLGLSTGVAVELETGWNLDTNHGGTSAAVSCEVQEPKILISNPPCPLLLKLQSSNIGNSIQLDPT